MVDLVAVTQPAQHLNRLIQAGLIHKHRREASLQSSVALDVLAILVQRRRADALQLAAGQGRL